MRKTVFISWFRLLPVAAVASCAPKAVVVVEQPAGPSAAATNEVPEPEVPATPDDGLRLNEERLLSLPGDAEFRATGAPTAAPAGGAVTVRPPTEPQSRPKQDATQPEAKSE